MMVFNLVTLGVRAAKQTPSESPKKITADRYQIFHAYLFLESPAAIRINNYEHYILCIKKNYRNFSPITAAK